MKPERIQVTAPIPKPTPPTWGVYQTFEFETFQKASNFSNFVTDMAGNHGRKVRCSLDSNRLTLFAPVSPSSPGVDVVAATSFLDLVLDLYVDWSGLAEES